jgi:hypothetical protein
MPDAAREVVFPEGVPLSAPPTTTETPEAPAAPKTKPPDREEPGTHSAEGGLASQAGEIEQQASHSRLPEGGQNLLDS